MSFRRIVVSAFASLALIMGLGVAASPSASAWDNGGNGNPYYSCPGGYTVASKSIYNRSGTRIGLVEMRWSWACSGNWIRTTSYIGGNTLKSQIYTPSGSRVATGMDYATQNWSPYLRVAASARMCGTGGIEINDNVRYYASLCAS